MLIKRDSHLLKNLFSLHSEVIKEQPQAFYDRTEKSIKDRHAKAERLGAFVKALAAQGASVTEFDEGLWGTIVDFMTIYSKEDISVTFKDGTEIHIG